MNLKGIKCTKKMVKKMNEIGVLNLKNTMLHGLDEFKRFTWSSFVKQEFAGLVSGLSYLFANSIFNELDDSQLFIFNYYTDVTEMDIVTVLKNVDNQNVIIDIEYKTEEEAKSKLDNQLLKRINDHMHQLFLNEKYLVIGLTEDGFYNAYYYDSEQLYFISDLAELKQATLSLCNNDYVETILTQANDLAGINSLYKSMEDGEFRYYEETKRTTEFILQKVNEGKKAIVCLSGPGTGKTVVAFKLFFENENTRFLIMNQKFYNSLGLIKYFKSGRCFFGTDAFLSQDLTDKIIIIDEVQRLSKELILEIVNKSKCTILFGDAGQAFLPTDLDLDHHKLISYLRENDIFVHSKELKRSKRYNDTVEKSLNFLTSRNSELDEKITLEDYSINIFYDVGEFLNDYHSCKNGKKMFTTYDYRDCLDLEIGNETFKMAERDFYAYAISTSHENYIGHTLHAISFDVENNYVYLENVCVLKRQGKDVLCKNDGARKNEIDVNKFLNELTILFTRGKKSLNIYTNDFEVYLYLNRKLKMIK